MQRCFIIFFLTVNSDFLIIIIFTSFLKNFSLILNFKLSKPILNLSRLIHKSSCMLLPFTFLLSFFKLIQYFIELLIRVGCPIKPTLIKCIILFQTICYINLFSLLTSFLVVLHTGQHIFIVHLTISVFI